MGLSTSKQETEFEQRIDDADRQKFVVFQSAPGAGVTPRPRPASSRRSEVRAAAGGESKQPKAKLTSTVVVRNVQMVKWHEPPEGAMLYEFVGAEGVPVCWNIGMLGSGQFVDILENNAKDKVFSGKPRVTFYLSLNNPGRGKGYAKKTLRGISGTVESIFQTVENLAYAAMQLQNGPKLSYSEVSELLKSFRVCSMLIRDGRSKVVYVNAAS
jgi:hypothetical protein